MTVKQIAKYLLGLILFAGILGILHSFVSMEEPAAEVPQAAVPQTGILTEKTPDFLLSMPEEMLAPANPASGIALRENRVPSVPQFGFAPAGGFLNRYAGRDYRKNYALLETRQESLLPYISPTLEYVFLLRRILI